MRRGYELARSPSHLRYSRWGRSSSAHRRAAPASVQMAPEVGRYFRELRQVFRISRDQAARKLATRVDIIAALEAGDVRMLPPWPETCRIVRTYVGFAHLDPRPVLHSIEMLMAKDRFAAATMPQSFLARLGRRGVRSLTAFEDAMSRVFSAGSAGRSTVTRSRRRTRRALFVVALPIALLVLLTQTAVLEAAVSQLPTPVARMVQDARDYVTLQLVPVRDGLRWIYVSSPRTRRSDKLLAPSQPD